MEASVELNRSLNPWGSKDVSTDSTLNEMYEDTIDAGAKGRIK